VKILVINTKFLGDLIVSTPGLKHLRNKYPQAEIVLLVRSEYKDVLNNNPIVNRIISFDFNIRNKKIFERITAELSFWKKIRSEKFDVVISLQPGDRIAFLAFVSGAKIRIAPRKQGFWFLFNKYVEVYEDTISYLDYYNKIISAFTNETVNFKTEFFISDESKKWADEYLKSNKILCENILIGIHPGASEPTKIWKKENFISLIDKLLSDLAIKIIIMEGPQDRETCSAIRSYFPNHIGITFTDVGTIKTAALISKCNLFLTHDTGTRHLAIAVGTSVLTLMPDDNKKCWNFYDESDNHFVITGKRIFPVGEQPFLGGISVEEVYSKMKNILNL